MKKIVAIILALCALCFAGCGKILELQQELEEMAALTEKFSAALSSNDAEKLEECIHPDAKIDEEKLSAVIEEFEQSKDVDFTQGVVLDRVGDFEIANDSELEGNVYKVTCELVVGGVPVSVVLTILNDDSACGLYDFEIVE